MRPSLHTTAGFITPPDLLYVRNHGAVPVKTPTPVDRQKVWDSWSITISGLVDTPLTLTMNDLMALPQRELPVSGSSCRTAMLRPVLDNTTYPDVRRRCHHHHHHHHHHHRRFRRHHQQLDAGATTQVLLVCAGNRRKEQNMVKQTIGFNWGAAGLGTRCVR